MPDSILNGKSILAVDDEPDVLTVLEEEIKEVYPDSRFDKAKTYEEAVERMISLTYDVVILDIMGVRGFDLLELAVSRNFPVVMLTALGPYKIPYAKVEAHGVYTNTVPAGAFRGFGGLQVTWAYESQMDMIADSLGIDTLEFRIKNLLKKGDLYTKGDTPVDCDLEEGLRKVADAINWSEKSNTPNRAKGISCCMKDAGGTYKVAGATVKMSYDGSVMLLTGTVEARQEPRTALSQIVAEELAMPMDQIGVAQLDTDSTPYDTSTSASSSSVVMGTAVQRASQDAKKQGTSCA